MNEEELKEEIQRMSDIYEVSELSEESGLQDEFEKDVYKIYRDGFQKGKLEQKKEDVNIFNDLWSKRRMQTIPLWVLEFKIELIKQLTKEIGDNEVRK